MTQALEEGLKIFVKAIKYTRRTIEVKYEPSDTKSFIFDTDPEQDPRPGKFIVFMQAPGKYEPYDFDAPINKEDVPF